MTNTANCRILNARNAEIQALCYVNLSTYAFCVDADTIAVRYSVSRTRCEQKLNKLLAHLGPVQYNSAQNEKSVEWKVSSVPCPCACAHVHRAQAHTSE